MQEEISQIEKETTTPSTIGIEDITVSINQIPMPNDETSKPKLVANKQKTNKKSQNEKVKNHPLQIKSKQEIIAEYINIETNLGQKENEIAEYKDEITLLKCFKEKYITATKVLEETAKSNDKNPTTEIAKLQMKVINQEEILKENNKKLVEYKISTTRKITEIKKLKDAVSTNLTKINELEGIREQTVTQGRIG